VKTSREKKREGYKTGTAQKGIFEGTETRLLSGIRNEKAVGAFVGGTRTEGGGGWCGEWIRGKAAASRAQAY